MKTKTQADAQSSLPSYAELLNGGDYLIAKTIRSSIPAGRIQRLDFPEEKGQVHIVCAKDIPGSNSLSVMEDSMPLLAEETVNYVGEPIAICAAAEPRSLERFISQSSIQYEKDTPIFVAEPQSAFVFHKLEEKRGSPEEAFKSAYQIVEGEYHSNSQAHLYSEAQQALAFWNDAQLVIYTYSQWPHHVLRTVQAATGLSKKRIRVLVPAAGTSQDGKLWYPSLVSAHAALLALNTNANVFLKLDWQDDFFFTGKRAPFRISHRSALDKSGGLMAVEIDITINSGAYGLFSEEMSRRSISAANSFYHCDNLSVSVQSLKSNHPPLGPHSGMGLAQVFFAAETHATRIAELAQTDPAQWRMQNLRQQKKNNQSPEHETLAPIIEKLVEKSDFSRKHAAYELQKTRRTGFIESSLPSRGIGMSICFQGNGFEGNGEEREQYSIKLSMAKDGSLKLLSSIYGSNNAIHRAWKEKITSILNLPESSIIIPMIDTDQVPDSGPSSLSRPISLFTPLIENCCLAIKNQRFRRALPIEVGRNVRLKKIKDKNQNHSLAYPSVSLASTALELEVDPVSFRINIRGIWMVIDAGTIIRLDESQEEIERKIHEALGWAGMEYLEYRRGRISPKTLKSYFLPDPSRIPVPWIHFLEGKGKKQPRGIGELALSGIPAAFVSAVSQATGLYIDSIPTPPESIFSLLDRT